MFKNLTVFSYAAPADLVFPSYPEFAPCTSLQAQSVGFALDGVPVGLLRVRIERKRVPADVLARRVAELCAECERETGRKPGKQMRKDLKEAAYFELLPAAFPTRKDVFALFLPDAGLLLVGSTTGPDVDAAVSALIQATEVSATLWTHPASPESVMREWLADGAATDGFGLGRSCELVSDAGTVRYARHNVDRDDVREHLAQGKSVEALGLLFGDTVEFTLTAAAQLKSVKPIGTQDVGGAEGLEADLFIWRESLRPLLAALAGAFA
jgi:recombination associated protein RdgC